MNDIQDILSSALGDILTDFQVTTTATPTPNPVYKPKKTAKARKAKAQAVSTTTPKIEPNIIDEDEFDLRKAVIYAEIMTPKFKDEEF